MPRQPDRPSPPSVLDAVPEGRCPLDRAFLLTERAATVGFDWPRLADVLAKVDEEVDELREAVAAGRMDEARAELGDILFALANVARFLSAAPGAALDGASDRFVARFRWIEARLRDAGERPDAVGLARLDALWDAAKRAGVGVAADDGPSERTDEPGEGPRGEEP